MPLWLIKGVEERKTGNPGKVSYIAGNECQVMFKYSAGKMILLSISIKVLDQVVSGLGGPHVPMPEGHLSL